MATPGLGAAMAASSAPPRTPPPVSPPAAPAAPRRRGTPMPRWWLGFFLSAALIALGALLIASLAGYGPAVVANDTPRVVLPRPATPPVQRAASTPKPGAQKPTPKAEPPARPARPAPALPPATPAPAAPSPNGASTDKPRCGLGACWQEGDPIPQSPPTSAPCCWAPAPPPAYAPPPPCCQPPIYYRPAPDWQTQGHGSYPLPGTPDNPIVWRRYVLPGGSEMYIPGPRRRQ